MRLRHNSGLIMSKLWPGRTKVDSEVGPCRLSPLGVGGKTGCSGLIVVECSGTTGC